MLHYINLPAGLPPFASFFGGRLSKISADGSLTLIGFMAGLGGSPKLDVFKVDDNAAIAAALCVAPLESTACFLDGEGDSFVKNPVSVPSTEAVRLL